LASWSLGASRARVAALPSPAIAVALFWLLWLPVLWFLPSRLGSPARRNRPGIGSSFWFSAARTTILVAIAHAALLAIVAHAWAPRFTSAPLPLAERFLFILPRSAFVAFVLIALVLAFESSLARQAAEADRLRAELDVLYRRLEPHFLFNALNAIVVELRRGDSRRSEDGLEALAELLRIALVRSRRGRADVASELEFARRFLALARLCSRDRIAFEIHCAGEVKNQEIPAMILQPLVENAVRHGLLRGERSGLVVVGAERRSGELVLSVDDDGIGLRPGSTLEGATGVGLEFVRERLRHEGAHASLEVVPKPCGGTRATIRLAAVDQGKSTGNER